MLSLRLPSRHQVTVLSRTRYTFIVFTLLYLCLIKDSKGSPSPLASAISSALAPVVSPGPPSAALQPAPASAVLSAVSTIPNQDRLDPLKQEPCVYSCCDRTVATCVCDGSDWCPAKCRTNSLVYEPLFPPAVWQRDLHLPHATFFVLRSLLANAMSKYTRADCPPSMDIPPLYVWDTSFWAALQDGRQPSPGVKIFDNPRALDSVLVYLFFYDHLSNSF